MRKKLFAAIIITVVTASVSYSVYQSQRASTLSDLASANVEALAQTVGPGGNECRMNSNNWVCRAFPPGVYCYCNVNPGPDPEPPAAK